MKPLPLFCLLLVLIGMHPSAVWGADERELTTNSAVYLLRSALHVSRDGREIPLLKAIRQLKDPELTPLFEELATNPHPVLQIHGILGLAECHPEKKLDLLRIASIEQPSIQSQVISVAMDSNLLSDDEANQLINWPGLDSGVLILVATQQINKGLFNKPKILEEATLSDNLARKNFALLLQANLGIEGAMEKLQALHQSDDPLRDRIRQMLLRSALRYDMPVIGPWAMQITAESDINSTLSILALKTVMRFKIPQAQSIWLKQYHATNDLAQKTRLALLVLREAQTLAPSLFDTLISEENNLLKNIGKAGKAIAAGQNITEHVINLVGMDNPHPLVTTWALRYAQSQASTQDATAILLSLVLCYENAHVSARPQLLDDAIASVETLINQHSQIAIALLKPILENPKTEKMLLRGMVLAMIRSNPQTALELAQQIKNINDATCKQLLLLLKAKNGIELSRNQLHDLAMMVRGGSLDDIALRVQAGWAYIKQTRQIKTALSRVLN